MYCFNHIEKQKELTRQMNDCKIGLNGFSENTGFGIESSSDIFELADNLKQYEVNDDSENITDFIESNFARLKT